jgi:HK97 family phage prohead protease
MRAKLSGAVHKRPEMRLGARAVKLNEASAAPDGSFSGYASLFGVRDTGGDIVLPGAFRACLAARGARGIRMLFQHDPAEPIGVWDDIREDDRGLFVRGRLLAGINRAREVHCLLRNGGLDGLSIGFRVIKGWRGPEPGTRRLAQVDLWEISIVTFPMLGGARVHALKRRSPAPAFMPALEAAARRLSIAADETRKCKRG